MRMVKDADTLPMKNVNVSEKNTFLVPVHAQDGPSKSSGERLQGQDEDHHDGCQHDKGTGLAQHAG